MVYTIADQTVQKDRRAQKKIRHVACTIADQTVQEDRRAQKKNRHVACTIAGHTVQEGPSRTEKSPCGLKKWVVPGNRLFVVLGQPAAFQDNLEFLKAASIIQIQSQSSILTTLILFQAH